jgi:hypothetical protein
VTYGLGTVATLASFILQMTGVVDLPIFRANR